MTLFFRLGFKLEAQAELFCAQRSPSWLKSGKVSGKAVFNLLRFPG